MTITFNAAVFAGMRTEPFPEPDISDVTLYQQELGAIGLNVEYPGSAAGICFMIDEDETIAQRLGIAYDPTTFVRKALPDRPDLPADNDPQYHTKAKLFKFKHEIYVVYKDARIFLLRRLAGIFPVLQELVNATGTFDSTVTVHSAIQHIKA